ncbi:competence/damage-inducible protein CinA [Luminiphilus syltensis NOR5-1B]|uniref:CinA-like protein n=1 Tax=Luminiphilus syltensis NOR5-1B TaxID=565045 RepID=B8KW48_9GAMM|nr:CinA family nicotinamide mononucleotide deamidase-related protein [Luminiphilus syltensis]EED35384.1 competence/damage-inducible protein CinA [Luminiphilus syltensis NOR5-1B]
MLPTPPIALLMTGDELMRGDTVDSNSATIAQALVAAGLRVDYKITVGDDRALLLNSIGDRVSVSRILIINGGLGPTSDDLTAEVVAEAAGRQLVEFPELADTIRNWCEERGFQADTANLKQARLPEGAEVIANPVGSAAGFAVMIGACLVITTPGPPRELGAMLPGVMALVRQHVGGGSGSTLRLQTFGLGESAIQEMVHNDIADWPPEVTLGFRAGLPMLELKLVIETPEHEALQRRCLEEMHALFGDHIIGEADVTLAASLQTLLRERNMTITCAESCTGGLIASMLTQEPGASSVFEAGFVTYSNAMKHKLLGVSESTLEKHGAVSEPVVREMLGGALSASGADTGVAVSGIAGPDGGTPDKPVGTVWFAWGGPNAIKSKRLLLPLGRDIFQTVVAAAAIDLIRRDLLGLPDVPHYFRRRDPQ